ncbi:MAG: glycosyltransferase [Pyrinomonadaceae bacterium]
MIFSEISSKLKLSVVVASHNARQSVGDCLTALENQCDGNEVEIIVVDNSTDGSAEIIAREFPGCKLIQGTRDNLIPELWGAGIFESQAELVALTTTHFVPAKNWIAETITAHNSNYAGIGGAIENDSKAGAVSWAVYFCRYSAYMLPFQRAEVDDFAADNASYKRRDLERVTDTMQNGFWETFVHREMRKIGMSLALNSSIVVTHQHSFTLSEFMSQRFWHGRQFGSTRLTNVSPVKRLILILLSPVIPFLYVFRISRRVWVKQRNLRQYCVSFPILVLFLLSWSAGEFTGYVWREKER